MVAPWRRMWAVLPTWLARVRHVVDHRVQSATFWCTGRERERDTSDTSSREISLYERSLNCILLFGQPLLGVPHLEVHMVFFFLACSLLCCMFACLQMRSSLSMIQKTNKQTHNISAICMKIDKKKTCLPFCSSIDQTVICLFMLQLDNCSTMLYKWNRLVKICTDFKN